MFRKPSTIVHLFILVIGFAVKADADEQCDHLFDFNSTSEDVLHCYQTRLEDFCLKNGDYPDTFEEFLHRKLGDCDSEEEDCSEEPVRKPRPVPTYRKLQSGYNLYYQSYPRIPYILPTMTWGKCTYHWWNSEWIDSVNSSPMDPRDRAGRELRRLDRMLWELFREEQASPATVKAALAIAEARGKSRKKCVGTLLRDVDPWGEPYVYLNRGRDFQIFSKGPDRLPKTADDILPGGKSDGCNGAIGGQRAKQSRDCAKNPAARADGCANAPEIEQMKVSQSSRGCHCGMVGLGL